MKTFNVSVSLGLVGCKRQCKITVEDDASEGEIEQAAYEALWTMIEWTWWPEDEKGES